jgi:ankyrin repeat protein
MLYQQTEERGTQKPLLVKNFEAMLPLVAKLINAEDGAGLSPLAVALQTTRLPTTIRTILAAKANPNLRDKFGTPAYFHAAWRYDAAAIKLLLEHQADVTAVDNLGRVFFFAHTTVE